MRLQAAHVSFVLACAVLLCSCGRPERPVIVVIAGRDSLTIDKIRSLAPGTESDSVKTCLALRRLSLSRTAPADTRCSDSLAAKLAKRVSLVSGENYPVQAAALLLDAGAAILGRAGGAGDVKGFEAFLDSIFANAGRTPGGRPWPCGLTAGERAAFEAPGRAGVPGLARAVSLAAGVSQETGAVVASFFPAKGGESSGNAAELIKNLVATAARKERTAISTPAPDPTLALKYRPQASIKDSIVKRLPDLELIYKRQLKLTETAGGRVWITFRVGTDGRVIEAAITSSAIAGERFKERLLGFVRTIRFKAIPKAAGEMTFEFPFDFSAE